MRLVSTNYRPWGLIHGLGPALGCSGWLWDDFQKIQKIQSSKKSMATCHIRHFLIFFPRVAPCLGLGPACWHKLQAEVAGSR